MPPSPKFFFFLVSFIFASFHCLSHCNGISSEICHETEKQALLSFKLSVNDTQGLISSWKPQVDCCMWEHIVCSNLTGHVLELHLQNPDEERWSMTGLQGMLDNSLLNLRHLRYLNLSWNYFGGTIPAFIGSFPNLGTLDLFHAGFTGTIPHTIGNLSCLRTLILGDDYGLDADSVEWLSGLSHLEHLALSFVNLSKAVDWLQVVNTLPSLAELDLSGTSIPYSFVPLNEVNFSSLTTLDLSYNHFEVFPSWILHIKELTHLVLFDNYYSSIIPSSSTSNLTKLQYLYLSHSHNFTSIPDWIFGCTSLEYFRFDSGSLQGSIPRDIGNLTSLNFLDLFNNELSGEIPSEISKLCNIRIIDFSDNMLHGDVSRPFRNKSGCFSESLEVLDLGKNQFSGHLTDEFLEFRKNLRILHLGNNSLSGSIPSSLGKLVSLEELGLEGNKFSGEIPESIGQLYNLRYLWLSDNRLQGVVGENHFANLTNLQSFFASRNNLTLEVRTNWIPTFRVSYLELQSWNLGDGSKILIWLDAQRNHLYQLDLSNTGIAFQFPSWFWEIHTLNLSHNQLHGEIPDITSHSIYGNFHMYLSNNLFNGSLPRIRRAVDVLDLFSNLFSSGLHHFLCDESHNKFHLQFLHLGKNLLSGEIPDCWMRWTDLLLLNLGNNNLSGHIPDSIGLIRGLLSLDLYNNKLSGRIPSSLQNCSVLNKIDLAYNQLVGNLPTYSWDSTCPIWGSSFCAQTS